MEHNSLLYQWDIILKKKPIHLLEIALSIVQIEKIDYAGL